MPLESYSTTTLRRGDTGAAVRALQTALKIPVDGSFGPATEKAVRDYQTKMQLWSTGVVTPNMWNALLGKAYDKTAAKTVPAPTPAKTLDDVYAVLAEILQEVKK